MECENFASISKVSQGKENSVDKDFQGNKILQTNGKILQVYTKFL